MSIVLLNIIYNIYNLKPKVMIPMLGLELEQEITLFTNP